MSKRKMRQEADQSRGRKATRVIGLDQDLKAGKDVGSVEREVISRPHVLIREIHKSKERTKQDAVKEKL